MSGSIDLPGVPPRRDDDPGRSPDVERAAGGTGDVGTAAAGVVASTVPEALADRLRDRYQKVLEDNVEDFPVPGWGGDLVARVNVIEDREEYVASARAADADAAFVARATSQLLMTDGDGNLVELADEQGPIGFDKRFAALLGVEVDSASEMVLVALGRNPAAVTGFAERLMTWMQRAEASAKASLLPS